VALEETADAAETLAVPPTPVSTPVATETAVTHDAADDDDNDDDTLFTFAGIKFSKVTGIVICSIGGLLALCLCFCICTLIFGALVDYREASIAEKELLEDEYEELHTAWVRAPKSKY
jgi:hypothetical protein